MQCVIYTRVSLYPTGGALAVARQEQKCRALAERVGFDVAAVYSDNDISATNGKASPKFFRDRLSEVSGWAIGSHD